VQAARPLLSAAGLAALALCIARAPLGLSALLLAASVGSVAVLLRPTLGLYALAFAVPFGSLRELSVGGLTLGASELLVLGVTAAWLIRQVAFRQVRIARTRLSLALLVFIGTLCISLLPAAATVPAVKELAKWVELLLVYTVVASAVRGADERGVVAALLLAGPPGFLLMGRYMRAAGTFLQPNPYGGYLGLLLPLAYGIVLTTWRDAWQAIRAGRLGGAALWALAAVAGCAMLAGLVMSWSRGALLGLVAGLGLVVLALGRRAWMLLAALALVLALVGPGALSLLPGDLLGRVTETVTYVNMPDLTAIEITDANFAVIERAAHWLAAWRMFSTRPWTGVGTGQYATVYPSVALARWTDPLGHAHNYYLNILAEGGLLGLGAYLAFVGVALAGAWRAVRGSAGWARDLAIGALGMMGHLLAHSAFDNLYVHEMYIVVAMLLGMIAQPGPGGAPDPTTHPESRR
jgi:O-antigen ligase